MKFTASNDARRCQWQPFLHGCIAVAVSAFLSITVCAFDSSEAQFPLIAPIDSRFSRLQWQHGEPDYRIVDRAQMVEEGVHLAVTSFEARDGVRIGRITNTFESPAAAAAYFSKRIAKFDKIVKREPKKDKRGEVVGERVQ